jgi:hypothetical protein
MAMGFNRGTKFGFGEETGVLEDAVFTGVFDANLEITSSFFFLLGFGDVVTGGRGGNVVSSFVGFESFNAAVFPNASPVSGTGMKEDSLTISLEEDSFGRETASVSFFMAAHSPSIQGSTTISNLKYKKN